jgi:four helix bundle protein
MVDQMRRASSSITSNIVEGHGRRSLKDFIRFISIAIGSCNELGSFIFMSKKLSYITEGEFNEVKSIHTEVSKMLFSLRRSLESKYEAVNNPC